MQRIVALATLLVSLQGLAAGQSGFNFPDFANVAGLAANGASSQNGLELALTSGAPVEIGTAWQVAPQSIANGFDTTFLFRVVTPVAAGEGLGFVVHGDPAGAAAIGDQPFTLGYGNITRGLAVEIDPTGNLASGDLGDDEISVQTNGVGSLGTGSNQSIGRILSTSDFNDGQVHAIRVRYVPGDLRVFVDDLANALLTIPWSHVDGGSFIGGAAVGGLGLNSDLAIVGFTAANGFSSSEIDVISWSFTTLAPPDPCRNGTVGMTAGGPFDVLFVNQSNGGFLRTVEVDVASPLAISVGVPPANTGLTEFIIFAFTQEPTPLDVFILPFGIGPICFPPAVTGISPHSLSLIDSTGIVANAVFAANPAPFTLTTSGIPFPATVYLQGVVTDDTARGLHLRNQPRRVGGGFRRSSRHRPSGTQ